MKNSIVFMLTILIIISSSRVAKPLPTLCNVEPLMINAVDRLLNSTVRIFIGDEYWELNGLPDREAFITTNAKITQQHMAPVTNITSIVTSLEGKSKGFTYKFLGDKFWTWNGTKLKSGGRGGEFFDQLPKDGLDTAFHNANASNPQIIGLKGDKVFYYSTKNKEIELVGHAKGYVGGQHNESFPPDIGAAFTWPDSSGGFNIYMFREDKYCLRGFTAPKSGNHCDEWRENKELFGCFKGMTKPPVVTESVGGADMTIAAEGPIGEPTTEKVPEEGGGIVHDGNQTTEAVKSSASRLMAYMLLEPSLLLIAILLAFNNIYN